MGKYLKSCIVAIFVCLTASGQTTEVVTYDKLPPSGLYLTKAWRYSPIDNPLFADPTYGDKQWDTLSPRKMLYQLPELRNVNTGWLRLHFKVGPMVAENTPLLTLWSNTASEIYLDGKLLKRQGVLSHNPSEVVPMGMNQQAIALPLVAGKEHVLAVRFSPWEDAFYLKSNGEFMWLSLTSLSAFQKMQGELTFSAEAYLVLVSVFFLISLLHLSFYRYDPTQRANLFFSLYTITSTVAFTLVFLQNYVQDARLYTLVYIPSFLTALMGSVWTIKAMGSLFAINTKRLSITIWVIYGLASVSVLFFDLAIPFFITSILFQLVNLGLVVKAFRAGNRGAGIIMTGFLFSVVIFILVALEIFIGFNMGMLMLQMAAGLTYLAPAIGISLYLAREFALNSSLLREKLVEVKMLSEENLKQEQEKQVLLTRQNEILEQQVAERTFELTQSLADLKQTQAQLIQSEKMASLGELTAGIAHEIQNPLNFVNNFSEVSVELLQELKKEANKGDLEEVKAIVDDVVHNLEKIAHHGHRADTIVKGMLQHSRASTGQKELTDINKLVNEYLHLAYHGFRAKDKDFHAELVTNFAEDNPKINIIPQDIGSVLLNLFNNAFYAIREKAKQKEGYRPILTVNTLQQGNAIEITIKDNGMGIRDAIRDKIWQPFFTTKPTGQGVGLGLSLSYDIIVKGHGGTLKVDSETGKWAIFKVTLPGK